MVTGAVSISTFGPFRMLIRPMVLLWLVVVGLVPVGPSLAAVSLTDAVGRHIEIPAPARRIVFSDSVLLLSLALIDPDPVARIVGWASPQRIDDGLFAAFRRSGSPIDRVPNVGNVLPAQASVESILSVQPDLFVVSAWQPEWTDIADRLAKAGVQTVFLKGREGGIADPIKALEASISVLGASIDRRDAAAAVVAFFDAHAERVIGRVQGSSNRPSVMVDAFAGRSCCTTPGRDNDLTKLVEIAGGSSIGAALVGGYRGALSPEYVLERDPEVVVATGGPKLPVDGGLVLGGDIEAAAARSSLKKLFETPVRKDLTATAKGRVFGISHQLALSALNVLVLECFAKWIHPDLFEDLDPNQTLAEINRRFLPVPMKGTFWTGLNAADRNP